MTGSVIAPALAGPAAAAAATRTFLARRPEFGMAAGVLARQSLYAEPTEQQQQDDHRGEQVA